MKEKICNHNKNNVVGYRIYLYFRDYNLAIQIDKNGHSAKEILTTKQKFKKQKNKKLVVCLLELFLTTTTWISLKLSVDTSNNQLKNSNK